MLHGPSFGLYSSLQELFPDLELTASGGIGSIADIAGLDRMGIGSVIVGKALYENRITLNEIREYCRK